MTAVPKKPAPSAASGLTFAFGLLIEELSKSGSIDRLRYLGELKNSYNLLGPGQEDSPAGHTLHTLARWMEHGVTKK